MANRDQVVCLRQGVAVWNEWRAAHPDVAIDLTEVDLRGTVLRGANLSRAYLSRINLSEADLRGTNLHGSNLNWADLREADLRKADLRGADLRMASVHGGNFSEADLTGANLIGTDLRELNLSGATLASCGLEDANLQDANLRQADLRRSRLRGANLRVARLGEARLDLADLRETNLTEADLRGADLTEADLRSARLQSARLDRAILTGTRLWETQRSDWSIAGVVCATASWDQQGIELSRYEPGEFVRLYSNQARIELTYQGGITTFEVNTLPALLHHLASLHPECGIRLKSIEETGGGVRVSISVEEADVLQLAKVREDALASQAAQVALRDNQIVRLQIQRDLLLEDVLPRMLAAAGQHVQITGAATNLVISAGRSTVHAEHAFQTHEALADILKALKGSQEELEKATADASKVERAVVSVEHELQKSTPAASVVARSLGVIQEVLLKVVEGASEKAILEHWHPLLNGVTHAIAQATQYGAGML